MKKAFISLSIMIFLVVFIVLLVGKCRPTVNNEASIERKGYNLNDTDDYELLEVEKLARKIHIGMSRAQVGKMFPNIDGGIRAFNEERYIAGRNIKVRVYYDNKCGEISPENKVKSTPEVYIERAYKD